MNQFTFAKFVIVHVQFFMTVRNGFQFDQRIHFVTAAPIVVCVLNNQMLSLPIFANECNTVLSILHRLGGG